MMYDFGALSGLDPTLGTLTHNHIGMHQSAPETTLPVNLHVSSDEPLSADESDSDYCCSDVDAAISEDSLSDDNLDAELETLLDETFSSTIAVYEESRLRICPYRNTFERLIATLSIQNRCYGKHLDRLFRTFKDVGMSVPLGSVMSSHDLERLESDALHHSLKFVSRQAPQWSLKFNLFGHH